MNSPIATPFGPCRTFYNARPRAFLSRPAAKPEAVLRSLEGPTILIFDRGFARTRIVSCLIHGNEPSGFRAVARAIQQDPWGRHSNMIYFIGNVAAAQAGRRPFSHRVIPLPNVEARFWDMNRVWGDDAPPQMKRLRRMLFEAIGDRLVEGALDLHNNSGANPAYAVLMSPTGASASFAGNFSDIGFIIPSPQSLTGAFHQRFPICGLECGKTGTAKADQVAWDAVRKMRDAPLIPDHAPPRHAYTAVGEVHLRDGAQALMQYRVRGPDPLQGVGYWLQRGGLAMTGTNPFIMHHAVEQLNFRPVGAERMPIGSYAGPHLPLRIMDPNKTELDAASYFEHDRRGGQIFVRPEYTVAMATRDARTARDSCLFFLTTRATPEPTVYV